MKASLVETLRIQFGEARQLFAPRYLPCFRIVSLLWNCVYLVIAASVAFWAIYAREEVGMTPAQVGNVVMWAYIARAFGHLLAGRFDPSGRLADFPSELNRGWQKLGDYLAG